MSGFIRLGDLSVGHDGFPPTACIGGVSSSLFVNGLPVALDGALFAPHTKSSTTHSSRTARASGTIYAEGLLVVKTGDPISCGDVCGPGSGDALMP
jgi:uncharacterized Zn-binding protein involved in type VI secretion